MKKMIEDGVYNDKRPHDKNHVDCLYSTITKKLFLINALLEKENIPNSKELAPLALAYQGINYFRYFDNYT
jgi:hypothetical protein